MDFTSSSFMCCALIKDRSYLSLERQMCTDPDIDSLQSLGSISETKHFSLF